MTSTLMTEGAPTSLVAAPIEDATRREFITGVGAAALAAAFLAACGGDEGGESTAPSPATRMITNKYGTYEIPLDPQRVVLMENRIELETAVALGLAPIAIGNFFTFTGGAAEYVAPWVPYVPSGEEARFDPFATDIEYLLTLKPDLILSNDRWLADTDPPVRSYDSLVAVAPVVPLNLLPWREDLEQVAAWLGREDALAATFREFDALRDQVAGKHSDRIASARVAFGSYESPQVFLREADANGGPAAQALVELGGNILPLSAPVDRPGFYSPISMENLSLMEDADAILLWAPDPAQRDELLAHPLWQLLPAVRAGRAGVSTQNVGSGHIYTIMECLHLWDELYSTLV